MAGVKISNLPAIVSSALTDLIAEVQPPVGGVTYKATLNQVLTLFQANIQITEAQVTNLVTDLAAKVNVSGDTMTGFLLLNADPTQPLGAATKQYVDNVAQGLNILPAAYAATTAALNTVYNNGVAGVGATLTDNVGTFLAFAVDGVSPPVGSNILIKNQAAPEENGMYILTTNGDGVGVPYVLTRQDYYDTPAEITPGDFVIVNLGTANAATAWIQTATIAVVGTDPINWSQFGAAFPLAIGSGGTGATTASGARTNLSAAMLGANTDITSMTGLTGVLRAPTQIQDANGNEMLVFNAIAAAVNYISMTNGATGQSTALASTGSDATVNFDISSKGGIVNFSDNTGAAAGVLRVLNGAHSFGIGLTVNNALAADVNYQLPSLDGGANTLLQTNGSGVLSFTTGWAAFVPGYTGFSANPVGQAARFTIINKTCFVELDLTVGTSNDTTFTITNLPATSRNGNVQYVPLGIGQNNSANMAGPVIGQIASNSTTMVLYASGSSTAWTNSGNKGISGNFYYETN